MSTFLLMPVPPCNLQVRSITMYPISDRANSKTISLAITITIAPCMARDCILSVCMPRGWWSWPPFLGHERPMRADKRTFVHCLPRYLAHFSDLKDQPLNVQTIRAVHPDDLATIQHIFFGFCALHLAYALTCYTTQGFALGPLSATETTTRDRINIRVTEHPLCSAQTNKSTRARPHNFLTIDAYR